MAVAAPAIMNTAQQRVASSGDRRARRLGRGRHAARVRQAARSLALSSSRVSTQAMERAISSSAIQW